jgi:hypothetical protein
VLPGLASGEEQRMKPSEILYSAAAASELLAADLKTVDEAHWSGKLPLDDWRAHLQAKGRLYLRAGDSAKALEDRA